MKKAIILIFIAILSHTAMAQDAQFGQNKVQYKNFDWYFIQTPNFDIYFYKGEDTLATFAANALQNAYKEIKVNLNYSLANRVPIIIYASHNEFQQTNVISDLIPEGVGGFTEVFKNRIVIPFTGSYEDFRHVLHHELTHAIWFDLLYGNILKSLLSTDALFRPPLWFSEGYAEFSSRHGWDLEADMYMRDAAIQGYLPPLDQLDGFLAYKAGQSACEYISEKYGSEKISEILNKGKTLVLMERATKAALGVSLENVSDNWQKAMRRVYWPEIANRKEPAEIAKGLTDHTKDGSIFNQQPEWSPKGDRLAFFSDRNNPQNGYSDRFNEVYIISTIDGKIISRVVKAERSGDLESLHSYFSGLTWSPDGSELAFVGKSNGSDVLFIYDAETGRRKKKFDFKMEAMRNPSWSHDGSKIAFDGTRSGYTDLYIYDLKTNELQQLMHDRFDDHYPSWSNDGHHIAFASDRPVSGDTASVPIYGGYNIFLYDTQSGEIRNLVDSPYKDDQPAFSPDGARIAFVSNRNGIDNIYLYEMSDGKTIPVTDIISGAFAPSWSPDGNQLAFSAFFKYGFDIYILKNINNVADGTGELKLTHYMQKLRNGEKDLFVPTAPVAAADTTHAAPETTSTVKPADFSTYIFRAGEGEIAGHNEEKQPDTLKTAVKSDSTLAAVDTLKYLMPDGSYKQNHYKLKFAPELVTGGLTYDNFYGLQGQSYLAISDLLGNHHFYIYTDLVNTIDQSNIQIAYSYTEKRMDYLFALFHFKNLYYNDAHSDTSFFFSDRIYGLQGYIAYPFSKFSRLDLTLSQITVFRENYIDPLPDKVTPNGTTNLLIGSLAWTNDAVIWGMTGPVGGQRYMVKYDQSIKTVGTGLSFGAFEFDYRRYWFFLGHYNMAMRFGGGYSSGRDAKNYYVGGTSNWISPRRSKGDIYNVADIYVNELVVPVRGYDYFSAKGNRYGIFNLEFRYPFIDYFKLHFPLPISLTQVSGALFWDMGAAWNRNSGGGFWENMHFHDPRTPVNEITPGDVLAGMGFGPRINLGIFVLRVDVAWATNVIHFAKKPRWYFSFGGEF